MISLHYGGDSWFIDCDHVPYELVVPTFCSRCTTSWSWNALRRLQGESQCGSRRRWARPCRRSWAESRELGGPECAEVGYGPSWGECVELEVVFQQPKEQIP